MSEVAGTGLEADAPVNPYSLLEAVNSSSETAHMAWLIFLGVMTYLTVAVAGVTHKDLMLQTPVALPILQVSIQQAQFFEFAPIILVLMHLGLVSQLVLLARKTLEFDSAVCALEATDVRTHPLRLELHNFFFVQAVAGPHRSVVMSMFLHGMSWLTLVILPVVLLLYIQITFLPYHDIAITWSHRIALMADILMLGLIGIFLMRAETSFFNAFAAITRHHPLSFVVTGLVMAFALFVSLLVATIPDEPLDQFARRLQPAARIGADEAGQTALAGFALPIFGRRADGSLLGMFQRNLNVVDTDLRKGGDDAASISLRNRDLRYARLDRSVLARADLTNVSLDGASLVDADLREVRWQCSDMQKLMLTADRVEARCPSARNANLLRAKLTGAVLEGLDLSDARLEEAQVDGADLTAAILTGVNLSGAHLEKSVLAGSVQAQGTNFLVANLQGADLTGAQLQRADFTSAQMQGVSLAHAGLEGARLQDADLEAADLQNVRLIGTDMTGARLRSADLRNAQIWATKPPAEDGMQLADVSAIQFKAPSADESAELGKRADAIARPSLREQIKAGLAAGDAAGWGGSSDHQRWQSYVSNASTALGDGYKGQLTEALVRLMCKSRWGNGAIATGIAMRAEKTDPPFRGDMLALYDRLRMKDCAASDTIAKRAMQRLSVAADLARDK